MDIVNSSWQEETSMGCGCAQCSAGPGEAPVFAEDNQAIVFAPTVYGTTTQLVDQLVSGYWEGVSSYARDWGSGSNVTYSISNEYSAAEKSSFRMSFDLWSDVADITFQEVTSGGSINIVEGDDGSAWSGNNSFTYENFPDSLTVTGNTISIDTNVWPSLTTIGGYGIQTILHEIGHSLGLGHQGNYNGSVNYDADVVFLNDNRQFSIMSYNDANLLGSDHWDGNGAWQYASTMMMYDIAAIQEIYGANTTTRTGASTYGFNVSNDVTFDQYDLSLNSAPFAIWDGGGIDTLDLSGYSTNQTITLVSGDFTSAGAMTNNISIAFGTVIENAIGGSGNDSIYGNDANNILQGGGGDDWLYASGGNDQLEGGSGNDRAVFNYDVSEFIISIQNSTTVSIDHINGTEGDNILVDIEDFEFNGVTYDFSELDAFDVSMGTVTFRFDFDGDAHAHAHTSTTDENVTYTAADMNYDFASGNMYSISRDGSGTTLNVDSTEAPLELNGFGSDGHDVITLTGAHAIMQTLLYAGAGDDTIVLGVNLTGDAILVGEDGADTLTLSGGNDVAYGGADNDIIDGGAGADRLYGDNKARNISSQGDDTLSGGDGNDQIYAGFGDDSVYGGADNDILYGDAGNDIVDGGSGNDIAYGGDGLDTLDGGNGVDYLDGGDGADSLTGGAGADKLYGGADGDFLQGGGDRDVLNGGAGEDVIYGNGGNDEIVAGADNDTIYGDNLDRAGDIGEDIIFGGAGDDVIYAGGSDDVVYGDNKSRSGIVGNDTVYGDDGVDALYGGAGADLIYGGNGADIITGDLGIDVLNGDAGNDLIYGGAGADTINGGADNDTIYSDFKSGTVQDGDDILNGDAGNDILVSAGGNDTLNGGTGADRLYGGSGTDVLNGGSGIDWIDGGAGTDTLDFSAELAGVTVDLGRSYAIDGSGDRDTVLSIEIVQGSASVDRLVGNAGQNELHGNGGQDLIYGAHGDDVIYGGADRDIIYGDLKSETVSDGNDTLYGEDGNDVILGLGGDDVLVGGAGVDTLWGGSDADRFVLDVTGSVDLLRDFDLSEGDTLDISDILNGFYTGAEDIADYIQITDNGTHSTVFIDQNGGGDSYSSVGVIYNVTGITDVAQLELNGDLVTL